MAESEMDLLGRSRLVSDQWIASCMQPECEQLANGVGDPRLRALRHVRATGHTVRLWRSYCEELTPRKPPTQQEPSPAKARREARKLRGVPRD